MIRSGYSVVARRPSCASSLSLIRTSSYSHRTTSSFYKGLPRTPSTTAESFPSQIPLSQIALESEESDEPILFISSSPSHERSVYMENKSFSSLPLHPYSGIVSLSSPASASHYPYRDVYTVHRRYISDSSDSNSPKKSHPSDPTLSTRTINWFKSLPATIKHEAKHYWNGSKLLVFEIRICISLLRKVTRGETLTRRERRQLQRTTVDVLKLFPFSLFVIVPFMELLLPFFIKIFPSMLPSTFHDSVKKEEQMKRQLKVKLEVAKFLQNAVTERTNALVSRNADLEEDFMEFMDHVNRGDPVDNRSIIKFASLFEDEFTLDSLSRDQLVAMCKYMNLQTIGTNAFLRYQLTTAMDKIRQDDVLIQSEGVDSLTMGELQQACASRGLRYHGLSKTFLQEILGEWLDLSLTHKMPTSLLILANAFKLTSTMTASDAVREAFYHLPDELLEEIRLKVSTSEPNKTEVKLELLKKEAEMMRIEALEEDQTKAQVAKMQLLEWMSGKKDIAQSSVTFTASQMKSITDAVKVLAENTSVESEARQLKELKTVLERRKEELQKKEADAVSVVDKKAVEKVEPEVRTQIAEDVKPEPEEKSTAKERKFIAKLENKLETILDELQDEVKEVGDAVFNLLVKIDKDMDGVVTTEELQNATKLLKENLPDDVVQHVVQRLDKDHDGKIALVDLKQLVSSKVEEEKNSGAKSA